MCSELFKLLFFGGLLYYPRQSSDKNNKYLFVYLYHIFQTNCGMDYPICGLFMYILGTVAALQSSC
jgi:hypothetical protein